MDRRYLVFVSSTFRDLQEERQAVVRTLMGMKCIPVGMELFPAIDLDQWSYVQAAIDESDYVVLLVAGRYGTVVADGLSYTEKEFDYSVSSGRKVIALLRKDHMSLPPELRESDAQLLRKLKRFREKVRTGRLVGMWGDKSDIPELLSRSLIETIEDHPAPGWIRNPGPFAVNESDAQRKLFDLVASERVRSVDVLGHSHTTRSSWLEHVVNDLQKQVRIAVQHPDLIRNPEQLPKVKRAIRGALSTLSRTGRFEVRFHREHASLRLTILRGQDHEALAVVAGWYLYRENNRVVPGARNPSVFALEPNNILIPWADREFQTKWSSAERVSLETHGELLA